MKKGCELCGKPARMYCDSDQAILCWDCDERVHCANFLVAKHSRSLLCHVCQSPTPWKATGTKLGPTVSVCEGCSKRHREDEEEMESVAEENSDDSEEEDSVEISDKEFSDVDGDGDDYSEEEVEEDGENQVVPWSPTANIPSSSSAPPATTSTGPCSQHGSLSGGSGEAAVSSAIKRFRHNPDTDDDEEEDGCCSSQDNNNNNKNTTAAAIEEDINGGTPFRALKMARTEEEEEDINGGTPFRALKMARTEEEEEFSSCSSIVFETESRRRMEIMRSLIRFQQRIVSVNPSEIITGISKLSRDF